MKRRQFIALAVASAVTAGARAQAKPRAIGLLWNDSVKPSPHVTTLLGALRTLGWTAGRNLEVDDRVAVDGYGSMAESAAALVRRRCEVIVTYGATATVHVAKATKDIPVAMLIGVDPIRGGLVASLSKPGGNLTGVWTLSQGLVGKRLEMLRDLVPGVKDIGVLFAAESTAQGRTQTLDDTKSAASTLKLTPHFAFVRTPEEIDAGLAGFAKARLRGVLISQGTFLAAHSDRVVRGVAAHKLVAVYPLDRFVNAGGLLVYAPSASKAFIRLASCVDRLLKGAKPADTPIEQMSEVEMVINLRTAREQGIKIPRALLQRVDWVIE